MVSPPNLKLFLVILLILTTVSSLNTKPRLFFGGLFENRYQLPFYGVAIWDENQEWKSLTGGLEDRTTTNASITDAYKNDQIYTSYYDYNSNLLFIGGQFTKIGKILSENIVAYNINTSSWTTLTTSCDGKIGSISGSNDTKYIFVGGEFSTINSISTGGLAMLDLSTSTWSTVGGQTISGTVNNILLNQTTLYITGPFSAIGSTPCSGFAEFDITSQTWKCLGSICGGEGKSLAIVNNYLFVGGNFTSFKDDGAGGCPGVDGIKLAKFDLNTKQFVDDFVFTSVTFPGTVNVLATTAKKELFVGGSFNKINTTSLDRFALYNPTLDTWYSLVASSAGIPFSGPVLSVAVTDNYLYFGGSFTGSGFSGVARISSTGILSSLLSGLSCGSLCISNIPTVYTVALLPPVPAVSAPNTTQPPFVLIGSDGQWEEYNITAYPGSSVYFQNDTNFKYSILTNSRPRYFYWQTWSVIGAVIFIGSLFLASLFNLCVKSVSNV